MKRFVVPCLVLLAAIVAGCRASAPGGAGLCWRAEPAGARLKFTAVASEAPNLESCAAFLERLHLQEGRDVEGAFQGRLIFVSAGEVSSATGRAAHRYWVFTPEQRKAVDRGLRIMISREGSAGAGRPIS